MKGQQNESERKVKETKANERSANESERKVNEMKVNERSTNKSEQKGRNRRSMRR